MTSIHRQALLDSSSDNLQSLVCQNTGGRFQAQTERGIESIVMSSNPIRNAEVSFQVAIKCLTLLLYLMEILERESNDAETSRLFKDAEFVFDRYFNIRQYGIPKNLTKETQNALVELYNRHSLMKTARNTPGKLDLMVTDDFVDRASVSAGDMRFPRFSKVLLESLLTLGCRPNGSSVEYQATALVKHLQSLRTEAQAQALLRTDSMLVPTMDRDLVKWVALQHAVASAPSGNNTNSLRMDNEEGSKLSRSVAPQAPQSNNSSKRKSPLSSEGPAPNLKTPQRTLQASMSSLTIDSPSETGSPVPRGGSRKVYLVGSPHHVGLFTRQIIEPGWAPLPTNADQQLCGLYGLANGLVALGAAEDSVATFEQLQGYLNSEEYAKSQDGDADNPKSNLFALQLCLIQKALYPDWPLGIALMCRGQPTHFEVWTLLMVSPPVDNAKGVIWLYNDNASSLGASLNHFEYFGPGSSVPIEYVQGAPSGWKRSDGVGYPGLTQQSL